MATEEYRLEGRKLDGRYQLEAEVASGGMGSVWRAVDEVLGRPVAVKILHERLARDPEILERFRLEAVAAARLSHPCVVRVFDTGVDGGACYIVMELFPGQTLGDLLSAEGHLPPGDAARMIHQVLQGLAHAHREGVVHRDVKPSNILVDNDGQVKVTDFGIAKAAFASLDLTTTGNLLGTARYFAPEQVSGGAVDARTDLYAAGVVLYELLTGRVPFEAETHIATATMRLTSDPVSPRSLRPGIPRNLEAVVMRALARDPEGRFQSGEEMAAALDRSAPSPTRRLSAPPGRVDHRAASWFRSWMLVPLILVVLAGLAVGSFFLVERLLAGAGPGPGPEPARPDPHPIVGAEDIDPLGDGAENGEDVELAFDGSRETSWTTEGYRQIKFGGIKEGVGIRFDLDRPREVAEVRIRTSLPGWEFQLYGLDDPNQFTDPLSDTGGQDTFEAAGSTVSVSVEPVEHQFWVVWITLLAEEEAGSYRADVAEVDFFPPPE